MSDDFDLEMEDYLSMTPAEQEAEDRRLDAEFDNMMRERSAMLARMTVPQRVAFHRDSWLRIIRENRARLRNPNLNHISAFDDIWRGGIRRGQVELVKLRIWRATGTYPGEA